MKRCMQCENTKPIEDFSENRVKRDSIYSVCAACRGDVRRHNGTYRQRAIAAGKCSGCYARKPVKGKACCQQCLDRKKLTNKQMTEEQRRAYYANNAEYLIAKRREYVQSRKDAGLCVLCGAHHDRGTLYCKDCQLKQTAKQIAKRKIKKALEASAS